MEGISQLHSATGKTDEDNCADEDPFFKKRSAMGKWMDGSRRGLEFTSRFDLPIDLRILEGIGHYSIHGYALLLTYSCIEDLLFCVGMSPASYLSRYCVIK